MRQTRVSRITRCVVACAVVSSLSTSHGGIHCPNNCDWNVCSGCATGPPPAPAHSDNEQDDNPCGLHKNMAPSLGPRVFGGVMTAIYLCGTVADIQIVPKCETRRQVRIMLGQLRAVKNFQYVYDNACALAQHVRAQHRRHKTSVSEQLAHLIYVLDRWHKRNHTACLDPASARHVPEVDVDQYPDLHGLNTDVNEHFNSWIGRFAGEARHMHPATFSLFILLLSNVWNTKVVQHVPAQMHGGPRGRFY